MSFRKKVFLFFARIAAIIMLYPYQIIEVALFAGALAAMLKANVKWYIATPLAIIFSVIIINYVRKEPEISDSEKE